MVILTLDVTKLAYKHAIKLDRRPKNLVPELEPVVNVTFNYVMAQTLLSCANVLIIIVILEESEIDSF